MPEGFVAVPRVTQAWGRLWIRPGQGHHCGTPQPPAGWQGLGTSQGALLDSGRRSRRICGRFASVWSDCARGVPMRGCSQPGRREAGRAARRGRTPTGTSRDGPWGSPGETRCEGTHQAVRGKRAVREPGTDALWCNTERWEESGLWGRCRLWGGAALHPVPGSLRRWGGLAAAQDGGGQRSEFCPAPPALSLLPDSPPLSPALSAHRLSRSVPAARVGGVRDHGLHHRLRVGEVGAAAPLARRGMRRGLRRARPGRSCRDSRTSGREHPQPFPGAFSRLFRVRLRPRPRSGLRDSSRAVSELSERSDLIPVCNGLEYAFRKLMCFLGEPSRSWSL